MLEHYIGPIELPSYGVLEKECPKLMQWGELWIYLKV
jgi:hypothetical protein